MCTAMKICWLYNEANFASNSHPTESHISQPQLHWHFSLIIYISGNLSARSLHTLRHGSPKFYSFGRLFVGTNELSLVKVKGPLYILHKYVHVPAGSCNASQPQKTTPSICSVKWDVHSGSFHLLKADSEKLWQYCKQCQVADALAMVSEVYLSI